MQVSINFMFTSIVLLCLLMKNIFAKLSFSPSSVELSQLYTKFCHFLFLAKNAIVIFFSISPLVILLLGVTMVIHFMSSQVLNFLQFTALAVFCAKVLSNQLIDLFPIFSIYLFGIFNKFIGFIFSSWFLPLDGGCTHPKNVRDSPNQCSWFW